MNKHSGRTNQGKENAGQVHKNNIEPLEKRKKKFQYWKLETHRK